MSDRTYRAVVATCRVLFRALGLRITVRGAHRLPAAGPAVVAANHNGFADFTFVGLAGVQRGRLVRFMAKESVFHSRLAGPLMRRMGHIPVDRSAGAAAAVAAAHALQRGELVGVFPEATISRSFLLKDVAEFRHGAAKLALELGVPLVPVAHWGGHRVLTAGGRSTLRRGIVVTIVVGEPLLPLPGESAATLTARLHEALEELLVPIVEHYPQRPVGRATRRAWWWPARFGGAAPATEEAARLDAAGVARADARAAARAARRAGARSRRGRAALALRPRGHDKARMPFARHTGLS
jgi:1-acyl-sn-glycerol-3-phosphate acyltransferase